MYPNEFTRLPSRKKPPRKWLISLESRGIFTVQERFSGTKSFFNEYPFPRLFSMTVVMGGKQLQLEDKEKTLTLSPFLRDINLELNR
jgi:hypothetical protein